VLLELNFPASSKNYYFKNHSAYRESGATESQGYQVRKLIKVSIEKINK
jgi:hypothetical protein